MLYHFNVNKNDFDHCAAYRGIDECGFDECANELECNGFDTNAKGAKILFCETKRSRDDKVYQFSIEIGKAGVGFLPFASNGVPRNLCYANVDSHITAFSQFFLLFRRLRCRD